MRSPSVLKIKTTRYMKSWPTQLMIRMFMSLMKVDLFRGLKIIFPNDWIDCHGLIDRYIGNVWHRTFPKIRASKIVRKTIIQPNFVLIFIAISLVLIFLKWNTLHAPFHWDVMGFAVPIAENIYHHGVFITKTGSTGHPPLFLAILALTWKIFGKSLFVSHFLNIILGALGLTCLFFLANKL